MVSTYFEDSDLEINVASFESSHAWLSGETKIWRRTGPTDWREPRVRCTAMCFGSAEVSVWASSRSAGVLQPQPTLDAEPRQHRKIQQVLANQPGVWEHLP